MSNEQFKLNLLTKAIYIIFLILGVRLFYLQVIKHEFYTEVSKTQSSKTITVPQNRGMIYDRDGNMVAINKKVASLYVFGNQIENSKELIMDLRKNGIRLSSDTIKKLNSNVGFIWIERGLDVQKAIDVTSKVKDLNYFIHENRFYPYQNIFSKIVGFTGVDNQGLFGLEHSYENYLKGDEIKVICLRDSRGKLILFHDKEYISSSDKGLSLTLKSDFQVAANGLLQKGMVEFGASKGIVAGMDVYTGEVLFSVSLPDFDPNKYESFPKEYWKNQLTSYLFEPGSIFKPVTYSYLMEHGLLKLNDKINCENGKYRIHNHTINDVHAYGMLSVEEVLIKSSNIGTIKLSEKIPNKVFYDHIKTMGFGEYAKTVGLTEERGLVRNYKQWSGLSKPSISIGQEILVTPIQVLRFYSALANGGYMVSPKIIMDRKVSGQNDNITKVLDGDKLISLNKILRKVVLEGTATNAKSDYIEIAGKTGTAQKFDAYSGKYSSNEYVASFAGFFPADKPAVAMIVIYENPKKSIYGGTTAAITFKQIAEQISILSGYKVKKLKVAYADKKNS